MFRMDTHTKQIFFAGILAYVTTVSGLVFSYSIMQENHNVRIEVLEKSDIQSGVEIKLLVADMTSLRAKHVGVEVLLSIINTSVVNLNATNQELVKIVAKLEERSKIK